MEYAEIEFAINLNEKGLCRSCKNVVPDIHYYNLCKYLEGVGIHSPIIKCNKYKTIKMIEGKELLEFATEMIKVLNEKTEKYEKNNNYEDCTPIFLFNQLEKQVEKYLTLPVYKRHSSEYAEYKKRRLIHIANFALLLFNKL